MRCIVGNESIKAFAKAIHSLARLSDEVRFTSNATELVIEALESPTASAYSQITFHKDYFQMWTPNEHVDLKLKSKSLLLVYRNPAGMKNQLEHSEMWLDNDKDEGYFQHTNHFKVTKKYYIPILTSVRASSINIPDYASYPVHVLCSIKLMLNELNIIRSDLVSMLIRPLRIKVETGDDELRRRKYSRFYFQKREFQAYRVDQTTNITFSLKIWRRFLNMFMDKKGPDLNIFFSNDNECGVLEVSLPNFNAKLVFSIADRNYSPESPIPEDGSAGRTTHFGSIDEDLYDIFTDDGMEEAYGNLQVSDNLSSFAPSSGQIDRDLVHAGAVNTSEVIESDEEPEVTLPNLTNYQFTGLRNVFNPPPQPSTQGSDDDILCGDSDDD